MANRITDRQFDNESSVCTNDYYDQDGMLEGPAVGRFECPGCGRRAEAKNGRYCQSCHAFVHLDCRKEDVNYKKRCPVCNTVVE